MNIRFYNKLNCFFSFIAFWRDNNLACLKTNNFQVITGPILTLFGGRVNRLFVIPGVLVFTGFGMNFSLMAQSSPVIFEPVQACVIARDVALTDSIRLKFAQCLGWEEQASSPVCLGSYKPLVVTPLTQADQIHIMADNVSLYREKRSTLSGHVEIQQAERVVNAQTAFIYRNTETNKVTKIEFLGNVRYLEPDKLMIARKAVINPQDNSGMTTDVLYRFKSEKKDEPLPAWGRASLIQRFANKNYLLHKATYTTCAPQDKAWDIEAGSIELDNEKGMGVARNAKIRIREWPVLYTPYLSFPLNKERKSGFLLPLVGYSNVGGFDFGLPYYWNMATNYDLTLIPHLYSERGVMMGGDFRYLTTNSIGHIGANILPQDRAYSQFLQNNEVEFPWLRSQSTNRWSFDIRQTTQFTSNLQLNVNVQQVSDDYYLQDFSSNLALLTQRQLLRQADLNYTTEHWFFRGMAQSYQTLHPINESPISNVYERLPQLMAHGFYTDLPWHANLNILGQYDQFHWPDRQLDPLAGPQPQGPRFHLNPILSFPHRRPWGYITPSVQVVENRYEVQNNWGAIQSENNRTIPRYSLDGGLYFDRNTRLLGSNFIQTLEPRLFYLNVPYQNQTTIPVYDSGNMIFNADQLFRTNRFSGFDRIGDANQLAYALTSRWLSEETGSERLNIAVGQIKYFSKRRVQLCQSVTGFCLDDPNAFGNLSSDAPTSPIASRATYHFNPIWGITGDYVWDPATNAANNSDLNLHYQPDPDRIITLGYSYFVNGDMTQVRERGTENNSLHQATLAGAWPLNDKWSAVSAYTHNISKNYSMMTLAGLQYDSCCWAVRALGGRTFKSLNSRFEPQYNNNIYLQIMLKGLGSVSNSDPSGILSTFIPGYNDHFR